MRVFELIGIMMPVYILMHHTASSHSRPDDGARRDKGLIIVAVQLFDQLSHGGGFDIKTTDGIAGAELFADVRIFFEPVDIVYIDVDVMVAFYEIDAFPDMPQAPLTEYIQLIQPDGFGDKHIHHRGGETFGGHMQGTPGSKRLIGDEDAAGMDAE